MTGLPPDVAVLVIAFGLVLALGCYLVTNLSPGGMITPGWLALALIVEPRLAVVIGVVVAVTYFLCQALQRVVILYGKRLFATVVLVAVFFQLTAFLFLVRTAGLYDVTTLGFIVPGLVAYQLIRQPAFATITATATVTMVAYCVTLAGILLRLIPTEERVAANGIAATPSEAFSPLQLALAATGFVVVLAVIAVQMRRVRGAALAEPAFEAGGEVADGRRIAGLGWVATLGRGGARTGAGHDEHGTHSCIRCRPVRRRLGTRRRVQRRPARCRLGQRGCHAGPRRCHGGQRGCSRVSTAGPDRRDGRSTQRSARRRPG